MIFRPASIAALVASLFLVTTGTADASGMCERLNARLANLPGTVTSNSNPRDYTGAISRQNIDLRKARSDRRRLGCSGGSILVIGGANEAECGEIADMIAQMELNLETLKARRQYLVSGGENDVMRRRILAAMRVNGCDEEQDRVIEAATAEPETHRNIIRDLPPIGEEGLTLRGGNDEGGFAIPGNEQGQLRTMCVRTCDGAFFPISSNASPTDFQRDAQACSRRCPGAETALYYHELATEEADQMISAATGEPYTNLPTAFAYKTRDPGQPGQCGCTPVKRAAVNQSMPAPGKAVVNISTQTKPVEQTKPEPAPQPKSIVAERPYDPGETKVRVVGPVFLPPQETAIDLKHPQGPGYQPQQTN